MIMFFQVNMRNVLFVVKDIHNSILLRSGSESNSFSSKGFGYLILTSIKRDDSTRLYLADYILWSILYLFKLLCEGTLADLIKTSWYFHVQRLVWPFTVVYHTPVVKTTLRFRSPPGNTLPQKLSFECLMEALILA